MATGDRSYEPIVVQKRIDKSTPLIAKALCDNQVVEATWTFYRPNIDGDGTTQPCFEVRIQGGRIAKIERVSSSSIDPASANEPMLEEVSFVFHTISWSDLVHSVEHEDNWSLRNG